MNNKDKFILDATAGFRMMWFNKKHPNTIYIDQKADCKPDVVIDFRDLKGFTDESFNLVVFDPPHCIWLNEKTEMNKAFGRLRKETWFSDLTKAFNELFRVLKPKGVLIFKWGTHDISVDSVLRCSPIKPLFGTRTKTSHRKHDENHPYHTYWFCFMKIPESKQ